MLYLKLTVFRPDDSNSVYEVEINEDGLTVWSEHTAETMSEDTARKVHAALGRWLVDRERGHLCPKNHVSCWSKQCLE